MASWKRGLGMLRCACEWCGEPCKYSRRVCVCCRVEGRIRNMEMKKTMGEKLQLLCLSGVVMEHTAQRMGTDVVRSGIAFY